MAGGRPGRPILRVGLLGLALLAAACGGGGAGAPARGDGELFQMEITVTHWPTLLYAVPYAVAMENGYFEDEGIEITEIVGSEGGGTTVRNVITGGLPLGEVATPAAVQAAMQGANVTIVGGGVAGIDEINWVAAQDSDISGIEDLVGTRVGFTNPGSVTQGLLNLSLSRQGIDPQSVRQVATGGVSEGLTLLEEGGVEATANLEPVFSAQGGEDTWKVVFWASEYVPAFQQTVIIASPELVEDNPDVLRGFLAARQRAVDFIRDNVEEAARIYAEVSELPEEATLAALKRVDPERYYATGLVPEGLQAVEEEMQLIELLEPGQEVAWEDLINQEFLPEGAGRIDPGSV